MFYFLLAPIVMYNGILVAAAVIPAAVLLMKVYKSDRLEKESGQLIWNLVKAGVLSSLIALVLERIGDFLLSVFVAESSPLYNILLYFVVVALCEEGAKYWVLKRRTWSHPEFNCLYDGVIYAVSVSLGFAAWENISYVLSYGFSTALVRAVTAIPGHACFGVFMGVFYSLAKMHDIQGNADAVRLYRIAALLVPVLLHGAYDYIASSEQLASGWIFLVFIAVLFFISYRLVTAMSNADRYMY